jgi:hypothetical protein
LQKFGNSHTLLKKLPFHGDNPHRGFYFTIYNMDLNMNSRDYFVVGCKVVGVYCIFRSIDYFVHAVGTFFYPANLPPEAAWSMLVTKTVLRLIPIVYLFLGVYLIKNGRVIHDIAYPLTHDNDVNTNDVSVIPQYDDNGVSMTDTIIFAFQFAGLYLIVTNLPDIIKTSSFYLVQLHSSNYNMPSQAWFDKVATYSQFLPSLGGMLLGIYLLKANNLFIMLALKEPDTPDANHESDSFSGD